MANPMPCKIHETQGEQVLADWLVTAQTEVMGFEPGNTFYVCMDCLAGLALAWVQATQEPAPEEPAVGDRGTVDMPAYDPPEAPGPGESEPSGPGVLEQIEHDDGPVIPASKNGGRRKSGAATEGTATDVPEEQAASADVHG